MSIQIATLPWVRDFIDDLENNTRSDIYATIDLLEKYGHKLSMPDAKPVGRGLWELRTHTSPAIRILYGFCGNQAVLLLGFKKQHPAIRKHDFDLARKRLKMYCQ